MKKCYDKERLSSGYLLLGNKSPPKLGGKKPIILLLSLRILIVDQAQQHGSHWGSLMQLRSDGGWG